MDEKLKQRLLEGGMDERLAVHFAHLFIRDPLVIFQEDLEELRLDSTNHFENLQSTNWQHMRFKPPPMNADIGWRVEFRSMEIQITDFENAAFAIFIVLVTRVILSFDLNFYIPIPRTTENMETAHKRDAVTCEKFWFRKDPFPRRSQRTHPDGLSTVASSISTPNGTPSRPSTPPQAVEDEYMLMSVTEIINGSGSPEGFPGLIPLVESYLDSVNVEVETRCALARYLELIQKRADGRLWTGAKWIRAFVQSHPEYKHDSVVTERMNYDLIKTVETITQQEGTSGSPGWEMLVGQTGT